MAPGCDCHCDPARAACEPPGPGTLCCEPRKSPGAGMPTIGIDPTGVRADRLQAMTTFVTAVETGGLASAARKLDLSPPLVTRAVAGIENAGQATKGTLNHRAGDVRTALCDATAGVMPAALAATRRQLSVPGPGRKPVGRRRGPGGAHRRAAGFIAACGACAPCARSSARLRQGARSAGTSPGLGRASPDLDRRPGSSTGMALRVGQARVLATGPASHAQAPPTRRPSRPPSRPWTSHACSVAR